MKRSRVKRVAIGVIVAIVLLVAADFAAASAAEYQVSTRTRVQLALPDDPSVRITGFPFLTQALAGDYRKVDVSAERLTVGQLSADGVRVQLYHVWVPFGEVMSGSVHSIRVNYARGSILITKDELIKRLSRVSKLAIQPVDDGALDVALADAGNAAPGSSVTGIDPEQAVRMVATTSFLGQKTDVSVIAVLQLTDGQIQISPRDIRIGSGAAATKLPQALQSGLRDMFTIRIDPGTLPFAITPTSLKAVDNALEVSGTAHDVVIGAGAGRARAER